MERKKKASLGEEIESKLTLTAQPAFSIIHKQGGAGCLRPTAIWSCWRPVSTRRSFNWIGETAILRNKAVLLLWDPIACNFCGTHDTSSMTLLDQGEFLPCCHGLGTPCGPRGYATQEDLTTCCFCIECIRAYNCFLRPCCGEFLCSVPCENGHPCFSIGALPFMECIYPVGCCLADSKAYREVLIKQVAYSQGVELTDNQRRTLAPPAHGMAR